jgi:hypothetical protein
MDELDAVNTAMDVLLSRCDVLISDVKLVGPESMGIDLASVEALATRMRAHADTIDAAVASAKASMGQG